LVLREIEMYLGSLYVYDYSFKLLVKMGRKPMKTALLTTSKENPELAAGGAAKDEEATVAAKISQDCSPEELKYLTGLSALEQKVCYIAKDHLESSYDLMRSSGFIAWKNSRVVSGGGQ
jgi:hypothetical protein